MTREQPLVTREVGRHEDEAGATPAPPTPIVGVVVGVDDSASARAAVAWAAVAAERRGVGLHLVEVLPGTGSPAPDGTNAPHGRARALLSRAHGIARSISPHVTVSMHALSGRVAPALVEFAAEASLLVVGSNGPGGPIPLSLGSIVGGVTRRCPCPVVLVPVTSAPSRVAGGPVVVALEDTEDGRRALMFAAEAADRRGVDLVPLVSSTPGSPAGSDLSTVADSAELAPLRERHPGLTVRPQAITERPAEALLRADADAQLIVVPAARRGAPRSTATSGWTGHFLPVLSACPVAVVSTGTRSSTTLA